MLVDFHKIKVLLQVLLQVPLLDLLQVLIQVLLLFLSKVKTNLNYQELNRF